MDILQDRVFRVLQNLGSYPDDIDCSNEMLTEIDVDEYQSIHTSDWVTWINFHEIWFYLQSFIKKFSCLCCSDSTSHFLHVNHRWFCLRGFSQTFQKLCGKNNNLTSCTKYSLMVWVSTWRSHAVDITWRFRDSANKCIVGKTKDGYPSKIFFN